MECYFIERIYYDVLMDVVVVYLLMVQRFDFVLLYYNVNGRRDGGDRMSFHMMCVVERCSTSYTLCKLVELRRLRPRSYYSIITLSRMKF